MIERVRKSENWNWDIAMKKTGWGKREWLKINSNYIGFYWSKWNEKYQYQHWTTRFRDWISHDFAIWYEIAHLSHHDVVLKNQKKKSNMKVIKHHVLRSHKRWRRNQSIQKTHSGRFSHVIKHQILTYNHKIDWHMQHTYFILLGTHVCLCYFILDSNIKWLLDFMM